MGAPKHPHPHPHHHHHDCCHHHHAPQPGPWEYTPSHLYPEHPPCGCSCCGEPFDYPHPMELHPHPNPYQCMPRQGSLPCEHHFNPMAFPPIFAEPGDPNHPAHYPGAMTPLGRPEPYYGILKIRAAAPTTDHQMTAVQYADGRYDMIPNCHVFEEGTVKENGPRCMPWDDIRGNTSNSEGMDCPNYMFNNSDNGASF